MALLSRTNPGVPPKAFSLTAAAVSLLFAGVLYLNWFDHGQVAWVKETTWIFCAAELVVAVLAVAWPWPDR